MTDTELYRNQGLDIYEKVHYSNGEHILETEMILSWYRRSGGRILDIGCSGGLHAIELAKKGHIVTGIDREASAIERARERSRGLRPKAVFFVADLEKDDVALLGRFDLVICIGNVISHIAKKSLPGVLGKIRSILEDDGIFLFDFLVAGDPFPETVREEELGIIWKRRLDRSNGRISMTGIFTNFGLSANFDLWGYTREEVLRMIGKAGFPCADISDSLDFTESGGLARDPVCLRCRAWSNLSAASY
jgi:SAM-dependent methyltransferase